jgi:hypothetical protein
LIRKGEEKMNQALKNHRPLGSPKSAKELLDMYFFEARSALLETAATLDRIERAKGGERIFLDPRVQKLMEALDLIKRARGNRAERFQILFSE